MQKDKDRKSLCVVLCGMCSLTCPLFHISSLSLSPLFNVQCVSCHASISMFIASVSADVLGLLKWKAQPERLDQHLDKLMKLDGQEIVKVGNYLFLISTISRELDFNSFCTRVLNVI